MPAADCAPVTTTDRDVRLVLDRVLPALAFVLTATALFSADYRLAQPDGDTATVVSLWAWGLPFVLAGVLVLRRRAPGLVLVLSVCAVLGYYMTGQPSIGLELPLVAAFFSAAEQGRFRFGVVTAVALLAFSYGWRALFGLEPFLGLLGLDLMTSIVVLGGAIGTGEAVRSRSAERASRAARHELERQLLEDHVRAEADAERRALARDVHDVLGHAMVAVTTQANVALESLADDPDAARTSLTHIKATSRQALQDIRSSLAVLSPGEGGRQPVATLDDLDTIVGRFEGTGLVIDVVRDDPPAVPAPVSSTALRIVQESLTNAVRHGQASTVHVRLGREGGDLLVEVCDDGHGAPQFSPGRGLRGMRERVGLVGGSVTAGPGPSGGFEVRARMPAGSSVAAG